MLNTFSPSSPTSITNRLCGPRTTEPGTAAEGEAGTTCRSFLRRGVARDEHEANASSRRHLEFLRLESFAADGCRCLDPCSGCEPGELRAAALVALRSSRGRTRTGELHGFAGEWIGELTANQSHRYRPDRNIRDRKGHAGHLLRIRHLAAATAPERNSATISQSAHLVMRPPACCRKPCKTARPGRSGRHTRTTLSASREQRTEWSNRRPLIATASGRSARPDRVR